MEKTYLQNKLFQVHCPIIHVGSYMKKSLDINGLIQERNVSLVFKNIGNRNIFAFKGNVHYFGSFNEELGFSEFKLIEIKDFNPGKIYGENIFFKAHPDAVNFKVEINLITYQDFDLEEINNLEYSMIKEKDIFEYPEEKNYILMQYFNREYIQDLYEDNYFYNCVCGALNYVNNQICVNCKESKLTYKAKFENEMIKKIIHEDLNELKNDLFKGTSLSFNITDKELYNVLYFKSFESTLNQINQVKNKYVTLMNLTKHNLNDDINLLNLKKLENRIKEFQLGIEKNLMHEPVNLSKNIAIELEAYLENNKRLGNDFDKINLSSILVKALINKYETNLNLGLYDENEELNKYLEYFDDLESTLLMLMNEIKFKKIWDILYHIRSLSVQEYKSFVFVSKYYLKYLSKLELLKAKAGEKIHTDQKLILKIHDKKFYD